LLQLEIVQLHAGIFVEGTIMCAQAVRALESLPRLLGITTFEQGVA
jgi:hypothetical protein